MFAFLSEFISLVAVLSESKSREREISPILFKKQGS